MMPGSIPARATKRSRSSRVEHPPYKRKGVRFESNREHHHQKSRKYHGRELIRRNSHYAQLLSAFIHDR